jgi:hypothetical protein
MKHNFTLSKININSNDSLISRIKYLKSKKNLKKIKLNENIITFSSTHESNPETKTTYFHSLKNLSYLNKIKNNNFKKKKEYCQISLRNKKIEIPYQIKNAQYKYKDKSLSNKIINANNSKKLKKFFFDENIYVDNINSQKSFTFRKYRSNIMDNIESKMNENNNFNIFYKKENYLLMQSFNSINNQIRKKINEIIMKKKSKENVFYNNTEQNVNNNEIIIKRKNNKSFRKTKIHLSEIEQNKISKIAIEKKKLFNCINSRISFPFFIKDKDIMNNFSKENNLEYKKYIETL